jgi:hypothetical protein
MDDRELLELAAKAAGIEVRPHPNRALSKTLLFIGSNGNWNPLTDDGDALRLAFALGMSVDTGACMIDYAVPDADDEELETLETLEFEHGGDIANLRRAIVRAAAEIGRAM